MSDRPSPLHIARQSARWERCRAAWHQTQPWTALRAQQHLLAAEENDRLAERLAAEQGAG